MKKIFTTEFKIGLSVIVAIAILIIGIDYLKGINLFKPANFYIAEYDNVAGLEISAPVTIDGYKVGQVREISFDYENHGKIKVTLALNKQLRLPDDSEAIIEGTLLSGSMINIKLGRSKKMLEVGENIKTSTLPDLMGSVQNDIMPALGNVIPKIDSLLSNLNAITGDPALIQSVRRLDVITNNISAASSGLNVTMNRQVPGIMGKVGHVASGLDTIVANLGTLSYNLKSLPLEPTVDNVKRITENLETFSAQLNDRNSTLGLLMNDPELYERLNRVSADVDSLIVDIKRNPKRYISIKLL